MELSDSGKVQKRYTRGNDLVYSDKGTGAEKQYYVTGSHGNVVQLTDESGKVVKTYEYDSFENEVEPDSKDENPFRYCGEYYDRETEEIYLRARYYQTAVGRFLTRDTYTGENDDPLSLHLYTYCENDGVNAWDPSGHKKYAKEEVAGMSLVLDQYYNATSKKSKQKGKSKANSKSTQKKEWINYKDGGKVDITKSLSELRVCTDGKVTKAMKKSNYYLDDDHDDDNETSCFGKKVAADQIPYIVVPLSWTAYKFSSGVIVNENNGNYLYCVVGESGPEKNGMGEVSIYAAWKMAGIKPPVRDIVKRKHKIGNDGPDGSWKIILFQKSAPDSSKSKSGWKYKKYEKFRKQIKSVGEKYYKGIGRCLN